MGMASWYHRRLRLDREAGTATAMLSCVDAVLEEDELGTLASGIKPWTEPRKTKKQATINAMREITEADMLDVVLIDFVCVLDPL